MGGTILNVITVAIGSLIGLLVGDRLPARVRESVVMGLGLITLYVGIDNTAETGNIIIPLLSIAGGVIIGELLRIDAALERFAGWLQTRFAGVDVPAPAILDTADESTGPRPLTPRERFVTGFVTASLVFCIGPLTFVGSIQDGMGLPIGFEQLAIKSALDFFASMAFAASFGVGVFFSVITVFGLQGGLALIGSLLVATMSSGDVSASLENSAVIAEMTATGGLMLMGLALVLLDIQKPRMANFLPALLLAPLIVVVAQALGIEIYPL